MIIIIIMCPGCIWDEVCPHADGLFFIIAACSQWTCLKTSRHKDLGVCHLGGSRSKGRYRRWRGREWGGEGEETAWAPGTGEWRWVDARYNKNSGNVLRSRLPNKFMCLHQWLAAEGFLFSGCLCVIIYEKLVNMISYKLLMLISTAIQLRFSQGQIWIDYISRSKGQRSGSQQEQTWEHKHFATPLEYVISLIRWSLGCIRLLNQIYLTLTTLYR